MPAKAGIQYAGSAQGSSTANRDNRECWIARFRGRRRCDVRPDPGSAAHHSVLRCARDDGPAGRQSTLAPDTFTTSAHFGSSSARNAAKSAGAPSLATALIFSRLVLASADLSPSLMAALSRVTIFAGVPAGATTPVQASMTKSGKPLSASVGTSGNSGQRVALATASARRRPSLTNG